MEQLVSLEGQWSLDLLELMLPRAVELRLQRVSDGTKSVLAALGSMFSKDSIDEINDQIRYLEAGLLAQAYKARGLEPPKSSVLHPRMAKMSRQMGRLDEATQEPEGTPRHKDPRLTKTSTRRTD